MRRAGFMVLAFAMMCVVAGAAEGLRVSASVALVDRAYRAGAINFPTYAIEKLKAINESALVTRRYDRAGTVSFTPKRGETTVLIHVALENRASYSAADQAFLDRLVRRPAGLDKAHSTTNFKFHFSTTDATNKVDATDADGNGVPDYVETMAAIFENVRTQEVTTMGYRAPYKDGVTGGDDKFDVYILNMTDYGVEVPDGNAGGDDDGNGKYAYIKMENDYAGFSGTAEGNIKVSAAHEYHHAIQDAYNSSFYSTGSFIYENTSTWMEDQVYDSVDDNRQYLEGAGGFFANPNVSIDSSTNDYRGWIHNEFLGKKFGQTIIKTIWENLDPVGKNDGVVAIVAALTSNSSDLQKAFVEFVGHNYAKTWYDDAAEYKKAAYETKVENKAAPHKLDYSTATSHEVEVNGVTVKHLAAKYYKFVPGDDIDEPRILSLEFEAAAEDVVGAVAIRKKKDGTYEEYAFTFGETTKTGECGVPDFHKDYTEEVILALANYSQSDDAPNITYKGSLEKGFAFVIDDTGSMGGAISSAKAAAKKVLADNKAAGIKRVYTLISFKDGSGTVDGQSKDEDRMTSLIDSLSASGGGGLPESSLLSIRQACDLSPNSDILMMTDAPSNSYGVDGKTATAGEVVETVFKILEKGCRLSCIYYADSSSILRGNDGSSQRIAAFRADSTADGYRQLCTKSGGLYFGGSADTEDAVEMILLTGGTDSTVAFYNGGESAAGTETTYDYDVPVDSSISRLQFVLNPESGVTATMVVSNPSGTAVADGDDGVTVLTTGGTTYVTVESMALSTGTWKVAVIADGEFRLSAEAVTDNAMKYGGEYTVALNGTIDLACTFDRAVSSPSFSLMSVDGSDSVSVSLSSDDGLKYSGIHTMDSLGTYRFVAIASGGLQRTESAEIKVSDVMVGGSDSVELLKAFEGDKDQTVNMTFTVYNLGSSAQTLDLYAASTQNWADLDGIPSSLTLEGGASREYTVPVTVPAAATAGDKDEISFQAINQDDQYVNDSVTRDVLVSEEEVTDVSLGIVKISYDSGKAGSGRVSVKGAALPHDAEEITADDDVSVTIDGIVFECVDGEWKAKGEGDEAKYSFKSSKSKTRADGDGDIGVNLDFKKGTWDFTVKNADLSTIDNADKIYVLLSVNGALYGGIVAMDEKTTWKFSGRDESNSTTEVDTYGYSMTVFQFGERSAATASYDSRKPEKGKVVIKSDKGDLDTYGDPSISTVQLQIDGNAVTLGTFVETKEGVYLFKSDKTAPVKVAMVIDLSEKGKGWTAKLSGMDTSGIDFTDGVRVYLAIGSYDAALILNGSRKSVWSYKAPKE